MSIKHIEHHHVHFDFKELETVLQHGFDLIMLVILLTVSFWFVVKVQIEPSANKSDVSTIDISRFD